MAVDENIGYLLQHLAFALARQNDQLLQERLGIGYSQCKILMVLERHPVVQQKDIAESLGQTEASVSRQIKLMHERSLLQSTVQPENRRRHSTTLTTKGRRLLEQAMQLLHHYHEPLFTKLSGSQQQALAESLQAMHQHVCQAGKTGACDRPFAV